MHTPSTRILSAIAYDRGEEYDPAQPIAAGLLETDEVGRYGLTHQGQALLVALKPLSRWAEQWGAETSDRER